jgi:transposase
LINFGQPCPVSDLFGLAGRELLQRLELPDPWRSTVDVSLQMIDELDLQIAEVAKQLRATRADHPYVPLLLTVPGIGWVLAYTIAAEIGDIQRFPQAKNLTGYTGLCPRVEQSGERDRRGSLAKHGPRYLRWALLEATMHALRHPAYSERYQRTKKRLASSAAPRSPRSTSRAASAARSGTCSRTRNRSTLKLREAPLVVWRPDRPFGIAHPEPLPMTPGSPCEEAIER